MTDTQTRQAGSGGRGARRALLAEPDFDMLPALKRGLLKCEPMTPEHVARSDNIALVD